ncbi:MAG: carboxypeptidase M32, partial [Planctomycetaceae bacterium]|nr:carboxypeptidase M32 [Planctomycetaceae bacterium]
MADTEALYAELVEHLRKTSILESCNSVLSWDEQTYLPTGGAEHRANQLSLISGLAHERRTAPRVGELLGELEQQDLGPADGPMAVNVREARRNYDRAT